MRFRVQLIETKSAHRLSILIGMIGSALVSSGCGLSYIRDLSSIDSKIDAARRIVIRKTSAQEVVHLLGRPHQRVNKEGLEDFTFLEGYEPQGTGNIEEVTHRFSYQFRQVSVPAVFFGLPTYMDVVRTLLGSEVKMWVSIGVFFDGNDVVRGYFIKGKDDGWPLEVNNGKVIYGGKQDRFGASYFRTGRYVTELDYCENNFDCSYVSGSGTAIGICINRYHGGKIPEQMMDEHDSIVCLCQDSHCAVATTSHGQGDLKKQRQ